VSELDLSLDDCLDLLGAGRNHKARIELDALREKLATVEAERNALRAERDAAGGEMTRLKSRLRRARNPE